MLRSIIVGFVVCAVASVTSLFAGERYAFLVAVGTYDEKELKSLPYARQDILEFRELLRDSGYKDENIVLMVDDLFALPKSRQPGRYLPESDKIKAELSTLLPALEADDSLVIALAGHGVQFKGDAEPYFCPANVKLKDKDTLLSLSWLYKQLECDKNTGQGCRARQKLLIVDACRNDPQSRLARSAGSPELESVTRPQMTPLPEGVVALFSCAEGQQALEHDPLKHGVFFYHLLEAWRGKADADHDRELTLDEMVAYTKSKTQTYARVSLGALQTPRQKGFFEGSWNLRSIPALTNSVGMTFTRVPAGKFKMGSSLKARETALKELKKLFSEEVMQGYRQLIDAEPEHEVTIRKDFYLGTYEVTQDQYARIAGKNPSECSPSGKKKDKVMGLDTSRFPVDNVSFDDVISFCQRLSALPEEKRAGRTYRLPTEAEWEYACRAGTTTIFAFGDTASSDDANYNGQFPFGAAARGQFLGRSCTVGSYRPNAFGLYDMHGNVAEWCSDWYAADYYNKSLTPDPSGATAGTMRVVRGGAWDNIPHYGRAGYRIPGVPDVRSYFHGFRVVCNLE